MRVVLMLAAAGFVVAAAHFAEDSIPGPVAFSATASAVKQARPVKPPRRGDDSCRWANDNECDEPDIGTGACSLGTDFSDCRALREGENDSCRWARDHECDEPNFGTGACVQGTDHTDCGDISWMRNANDSCDSAFNGVCEEPGHNGGNCAARTDRTDCHGRRRPLTINDHFFGNDDRQRVDPTQAPWRYIGKLILDEGEQCTATLIGRDVIVTAAHCIHTDSGVNAAGRFTSAPGAPGGPLQARVIAYQISPRFNYRQFNETDDIDGLDWALLRLDQPLGDRLGFAGVRALTTQPRTQVLGADLLQAGFAWDTGERLTGHINCHIVDYHRDNTFMHECDTTRGDSGSSFFVRDGDNFSVIGVDSSFRSNPNGPFFYVAVSAASFQSYVADFAAGRTGAPVNRGGGKPKHD